ncbi:MAG TPA: HAMP domain-containing sensor histidine kinase [Kofleriaceae bacterium]|nr:HAMP domain-containing sensor histidine kinase [Kofleriaceae bacterium]
MVGRRRLWGVFPIAAVLASAVGIAYLGAVSYLADRGMVAAKAEEQARLARQVAEAMRAELRLALASAAAAFDDDTVDLSAVEALASAHPIASQPFFLDRDGHLVYPPRHTPGDALDDRIDHTAVGDQRIDPRRHAQLDAARRKEVGACRVVEGTPCAPSPRALAEARRAYTALALHPDTGPEALLGLARLQRASAHDDQAATFYRELDRRFADRVDDEGTPYGLLAAFGLSEVTREPAPLVDAYRLVVSGHFDLPRAAHAFWVDVLRAALRERGLTAPRGEYAAAIAALDHQLAAAHDAGRHAARLSEDLGALARTAEPEPRGRPAFGGQERALIHQRLSGGGVVGLALERGDLVRLAGRALPAPEREAGTRAVVLPIGEGPGAGERSLASATFGALLPHLSVVLVQESSRPDPVAEVVRQRGRRHLALTGGLVVVLVLGLVATIRGAARERELARLKSDFVSTVSHELKTPLTSIRMFAEMLQAGVAGEDREREKRYHEIIVKESERLGLLIANLLDYAQIERGTRRYNLARQPAGAMVREAVATFARLREGEGQTVSVDIEPALDDADAGAVVIDKEVLVQALLNLLSNAVKYSGKPVAVTAARRADGRVAIAVRDHGPGIPRTEHERVFREFYRAPAAYTAGVEGTGLGLALVKRHVEAQGGAVELDSEPGQGATFTLVLGDARTEAG